MTRRRILGIAMVAISPIVLSAAVPAARAQPAPPARPGAAPAAKGDETAVFAGGCFWGIQAVFQRVKGVRSSISGYAGGSAATANYETVSGGRTGHAESVQVVFDPAQVSYGDLLKVFFRVAHDPTELNRQGPDVGSQYRSALFYTSEAQRRAARAYVDELGTARVFPRPIVTQIVPLDAFYPAEDYHQGYLDRHPYDLYIVINDLPKLAGLKRQFPQLYAGN